jgi:hypothetical protein
MWLAMLLDKVTVVSRDIDVPVADQQARLVTRKLAMEEDLGRLRHAADGTRGEVSQMCNRPGILIFRDHRAPIRGMLEHTEEELGIRFGAVDSNAGEKSVEIVVHALAVFRRNDCEFAASDTWLFFHLNGLVVVRNPSVGAHTTPVA